MRPVIAYLCTTFPKPTELFLQRELSALRALGVNLRIYSLFGGGGEFEGVSVKVMSKWKWWMLFWSIPYNAIRNPGAFAEVTRGYFTRRPPSWKNYWENVLGAAFASNYGAEFRREPPALIHAAWAGAPATAAWLFWRFDGHRYSVGCHAYDVYQDGGDWWLMEKLARASFVHTSTMMARGTLVERGQSPERIHAIMNGLMRFPVFKPLRKPRAVLRLLCVARLVPKKGLRNQVLIYAALKAAGVDFEARIAGTGPMKDGLERRIHKLGLAGHVKLLGHRPHSEIEELLAWADVMLHTGVVAPDGDRDGLPNVIGEAMAAGLLVMTSPDAATTEAITDGVNGRIARSGDTDHWVRIIRELRDDDAQAERLRLAARNWVETNFDAANNCQRLVALHVAATAQT